MDREKVQSLIARALGAVDVESVVVPLRCIDDEIRLRPISKVDVTRLGVVRTKGDEADVEADLLVAILKYTAVDGNGRELFSAMSEAAAFLNYVGDHDEEDFAALVAALGDVAARHNERLIEGGVEEGKDC